MPKKKEITTEEAKKLSISGDEGLRFEWIRFIDEYMRDFNGTRAYMEVFKVKSDPVAGAASSRLLNNPHVRNEICCRLNSQKVTEAVIIDSLWDIATRYRGAKTIGAAVKSLELLARVRGMIKPETQVNNFFEGNVAVFQPIVDKEESKEMQNIIEVQGRLVE